MARDNSSRVYTIVVSEVDVKPLARVAPSVTIEFPGKLSARARRQIVDAIKAGNFEITTKVVA